MPAPTKEFIIFDPAAKKLWRRTPGGVWVEWSPQPTMGGAAGGHCCAGLPDGSVITLDQNVPVFRHWDPVGLSWVSRGHPGTIANWIRCVSAGSVDAVASSGSGHVATYTGATHTWALLATFAGEIDVAENGALDDIWICQVGAGGEVKHYDGVSWTNHRAAIVAARGYDPGNTCRISRFGNKVFVTFGPYGYPFGGSMMVYDIPTLTWSVAATWGSGGGYAATGCWAAAEDVVYLQGPDGFGAASHAWKWTLAGGIGYIGYLGPFGGSNPEQVFGIDATRACTIYVAGNVIRETLDGTTWSDTSFTGACSNGQGSSRIADDGAPPSVAFTPSDGAHGIAVATDITCDVTDAFSGVDATSVVIEISTDGGNTYEDAWAAGAQQEGYTVAKSNIAGGFRYVINPDINFAEYVTVIVRVTASDMVGNESISTASFRTIDATPPFLTDLDPGNSAVHPKWKTVTLAIADSGSGADIASLNISITINLGLGDPEPIYIVVGGVVQEVPDYIISLTGAPPKYTLRIFNQNGWPAGAIITVNVSGEDLED